VVVMWIVNISLTIAFPKTYICAKLDCSRIIGTCVEIDDCWSAKERNATTGGLEADPRGMRALADDLHAMGLFLGAGYPGFAGHFEQNAHRLAIDWLVDSFKVQRCHSNRKMYNVTYPAFWASAKLDRACYPIQLLLAPCRCDFRQR
jgi:Alpha galactosidase A